VDCEASVERLRDFEIHTVYPGHGKPFPMEEFLKDHEKIEVSYASFDRL
jgi:hypothetical protein